MAIESNLIKLGISLPPVPKALASYVPAKRIGNLVFTSGQIPINAEGVLHPGIVGTDVTIEEAGDSLRLACLNGLAAIVSVTGSLNSILSIVKLGVYVASAPSFTEQHKVANHASELLLAIFGDSGKHTRFAVGVSALPLNAPVELELIAEVQ
jgi:enamine deaminase RidA (YjgF/YER057c/UK114 family)